MEILNIILYLVLFLAFVLVSSCVQNGIFIITRGDTYTRPDGRVRDKNDMIAYWFYKMVMKEKLPPEKVYYLFDDLQDLVLRMQKTVPVPSPDWINDEMAGYVKSYNEMKALFAHPTVKDYLDKKDLFVEMTSLPIANPQTAPVTGIQFYEERKIYVLGKYLRKPLVECLKCFPSIWGSLLYWPCVLTTFQGVHWWQVLVWIPYLLSCSYVNTLLFYKAQ